MYWVIDYFSGLYWDSGLVPDPAVFPKDVAAQIVRDNSWDDSIDLYVVECRVDHEYRIDPDSGPEPVVRYWKTRRVVHRGPNIPDGYRVETVLEIDYVTDRYGNEV